jgi:hypothetical protein
MAEEFAELGGARGCVTEARAADRRDIHFVNEVAKKRGLGEDLDVEEIGCGLERNGAQLV